MIFFEEKKNIVCGFFLQMKNDREDRPKNRLGLEFEKSAGIVPDSSCLSIFVANKSPEPPFRLHLFFNKKIFLFFHSFKRKIIKPESKK